MKAKQLNTKKLFLTTLLSVASVMSFAYTAKITNNGATVVTLKSLGNTVCTIAANQTTNCNNLDAYTAYQASYKGTNAEQGLFTIQKNSHQVLQTTPVIANNSLANFIIDINADGKAGSVDNFQNSAAQFTSSGICHNDSGGVTCDLSTGDNLNTISIKLDEKQVPSGGGDTPSGEDSFAHNYGQWKANTEYQVNYNPTTGHQLYAQVQDEGKNYIACWTVTPDALEPKLPAGSNNNWNQPWKEWDMVNTNICN